MRKENEALLQRWMEEVWEKGHEYIIDEFFEEDAVANIQYSFIDRPIQGRENYKKFVRFIRGLYTQIQVSVEEITSDGNRVVAFCSVQAKRSAGGDVDDSEPLKAAGLCQMIFRNGKIVQTWSNIDMFGTLQGDESDG